MSLMFKGLFGKQKPIEQNPIDAKEIENYEKAYNDAINAKQKNPNTFVEKQINKENPTGGKRRTRKHLSKKSTRRGVRGGSRRVRIRRRPSQTKRRR